ncbi:permease [Gallaecimonas kandeliae]|uniref:permease n=1 Tax=Gallaecimonas kandeliae TaxID=3029055 RepID=UPI0026484846|nr:permease [Gallaecimonas kandeliae]WKE65585.1 permease [Gallaecimonas kandeliae]
MLLVLSLLALLAGPLLYRQLSRQPHWLVLLDNFIFVVIGGLLLFHVMPEALHEGGWPVLLLLLAGAVGPGQVEHLFRGAAKATHNLTLLVGIGGLALHAITDGTALVGGQGQSGALLALGVVLHRLPVGLTLWWLLRPQFGRLAASLALGLVVAGTLIGYFLGYRWLPQLGAEQLGWLQGLVAGTLLHVVLHRPFSQHHHGSNLTAGLGGLLGAAVLLAISLPALFQVQLHGHDHGQTGAALLRLWQLLLTLSPWLLAAYGLALLLNWLRPLRHGRVEHDRGLWRGMAWGLLLPVCLPDAARVYPKLLQHGAQPVMALAFLLAAPVFGIDALLASLALLGGKLTLWRFLSVLLLALASAWLLVRLLPRVPGRSCFQHDAEAPLRSAFEMGYGHLIDHTAPWVITGLVVAATLAPHPLWDALAAHPIWQLLLVLVLALPLHLCATGLTPVVAVLLAFGLDWGAALALLLVGPALNLGLLRYLADQHSRRFAWSYVLVVLALAATLALGVSQGLGVNGSSLPALVPAGTGGWRVLSALALLAIFATALLRRGARGFVAELWPKGLAIKPHHHH